MLGAQYFDNAFIKVTIDLSPIEWPTIAWIAWNAILGFSGFIFEFRSGLDWYEPIFATLATLTIYFDVVLGVALCL